MAGTFDLRIAFSGLCLLVRDERDSERRAMHVLLLDPAKRPRTAPGIQGAGDLPPHLPCLYYNTAHREHRANLTARYERVALDGLVCGLPTRAVDTLSLAAPPEVFDLTAATGNTIPAQYVDDTGISAPVTSHITLTEGSISRLNVTGPWDFVTADQYVAWKIIWSVRNIRAEALHVPFGSPTGTTLFPVHGAVDLHVMSVPESQQGPSEIIIQPEGAEQTTNDMLVYYDLVPPGPAGPILLGPAASGVSRGEGSFITCTPGIASVRESEPIACAAERRHSADCRAGTVQRGSLFPRGIRL